MMYIYIYIYIIAGLSTAGLFSGRRIQGATWRWRASSWPADRPEAGAARGF